MQPVELSGEGLLLRAWQESDAADVHRACQDPLIRYWTDVPAPFRPEEAKMYVGQLTQRSLAEGTAAHLGVFDEASGRMLGAHGLAAIDRTSGVAECMCWVDPEERGNKVAERATRLVARWAFDVLGLSQLVWQTRVGNHAALLVAARVGFVFDPPARGAMVTRDNRLVDGVRGTLRRSELRTCPTEWFGPNGTGTRRAKIFGRPVPQIASIDPLVPIHLRGLTASDVEPVTSACSNPETARWTTVPVPYTRQDSVWFVEDHAPTLWRRGEAANFAIADDKDRYVGSIGLRIEPTDPLTAEIGYLVAPGARGRGYATAATRTICRWGFSTLGLTRILWRAHLGNVGSQRVAVKAGFTEEGIQRLGCVQRGERRDAWVASLLSDDCTA